MALRRCEVYSWGIVRMKNQILSFYDGRITIDPSICNGKPTIRGKRITVHTILEFLGAGDAEADILEQYPSLEPEDIRACQRFAAELMTDLTQRSTFGASKLALTVNAHAAHFLLA